VLLGIPLGRYGRFRLRDSYPLWCAFPCASTNAVLCHSLGDRQIPLNGPTTPNTQRLPAITRTRFSLFRFRSPLLTESRLLSLPEGNEMFHFPSFPPHALCVQAWVTGHDSCRVSPFGNPRITARLAAPRGLSQPPTSFIGSWCQGIHRAPLLTWPQRCSRPLCSSQGTGGPGLHPPPALRSEWYGVGRSFRDGAPDPEGSRAHVTEVQIALLRVRTRSLRTQQRAWAASTGGAIRSHRQAGCTRSASRARRPTGQCSTLEPHRGTNVLAWVLDEISLNEGRRPVFGAP
jgi:hypothetical protein